MRTEVSISGPSYVAVFVYLTLLTAAELGVYGLGLPRPIMVGALVALALAKAALVAMFFMHLAMERKGLWIVAVVPLVIVGVLLLHVAARSETWGGPASTSAAGDESGPRWVRNPAAPPPMQQP